MSKKKKKQTTNPIIEKYLTYGTIAGLVLGLLIGIITFIFTDNMLWLALPTIVLFFIGLGLGSYLGNKKAKQPKIKTAKSRQQH